MTEVGEFRHRVQRDEVTFHALHNPPGQGLRIAPQMVRLLRTLKPAIVHTRKCQWIRRAYRPFMHRCIVAAVRGSLRLVIAGHAPLRERVQQVLREGGVEPWLAGARDGAELLEEGATGRRVPAGDIDAITHAILADWQEPAAARARGVRAQAAAQRRFSLDGMVAAYGDLYERLLAQAASRGALQRA